ncbi:MAG: DUF4012 domain-containing protein [Candidatus Falkowbacteria bacterium]
MEIKKHNINIDTESGQVASNFVLDLRQGNERLAALKDDQVASLESLRRENNLGSNWLENSSLKNNAPRVKFDFSKFKQLTLFPFFGAIFKFLKSLYVFFWVDTKRMIVQLFPETKKREVPNFFDIWKNKIKATWNNFITNRKRSKFLHKFDYSRRRLWRDQPQKISDEFIKKISGNNKKPKWWLIILSFVFILLLLILPFKLLSYYSLWGKKDAVVGSSEAAMSDLLSAGGAVSELDLQRATLGFSSAGNDFLRAADDLKNMDELISSLASFSGNDKIRMAGSADKFLEIGTNASNLGQNLSLAFAIIFSQKDANTKIEPLLQKFIYYGQAAVDNAKELNSNLSKINSDDIPAAYRVKFLTLKDESLNIEKGLSDFIGLVSGLDDFVGANKDKRYLVVFQNNSEARASGGFIGSYALLDLREGRVQNIEVPAGGSYDTEGGLHVAVESPQPLHLVDPLWHFWDANWWSDWRLSAKNLMWFYEKSGGPSVDGVISFTPTVLERLLTITGPIDMTKDYGLIIDSNNFWEATQSVVEKIGNPETYASSSVQGAKLMAAVKDNANLNNADKNKPKKIIGDLINQIMVILPTKIKKDNVSTLFSVIDQSLNEKQVLLYFSDPTLQAKMEANSWAGAIKTAPDDYLSVVNTNIAGQKSDRKMEQKINHAIEVQPDNSIVDTLTITRTHTGLKNEAFSGVRNVDWMRVYVPRGSELISADGFSQPDAKYFNKPVDPSWEKNDLVEKTEGQAVIDQASGVSIYMESGKTVFANWVMTDPGQSSIITFKYRLPFKLHSVQESNDWLWQLNNFFKTGVPAVYRFSVLVQKQPGSFIGDYSSNLKLNSGHHIFWKYPNNLAIMNSGWDFNTNLDADKYYSILIK